MDKIRIALASLEAVLVDVVVAATLGAENPRYVREFGKSKSTA